MKVFFFLFLIFYLVLVVMPILDLDSVYDSDVMVAVGHVLVLVSFNTTSEPEQLQ